MKKFEYYFLLAVFISFCDFRKQKFKQQSFLWSFFVYKMISFSLHNGLRPLMCLICLQAYLHKCLYNPVLVDILLPNPIEKREDDLLQDVCSLLHAAISSSSGVWQNQWTSNISSKGSFCTHSLIQYFV